MNRLFIALIIAFSVVTVSYASAPVVNTEPGTVLLDFNIVKSGSGQTLNSRFSFLLPCSLVDLSLLVRTPMLPI